MYLPRNLYNRILTLGGVLLVVAFSGCLGGAMAADENKEAAAVRARLKAIVYHLAGTIGPRSHKGGANLAAAADFITGSLESFGYTVTPQTYEVDGRQVRNIIAEREGLEEPDHVLILGAHYDTQLETPGADDNASGVAVLLELAHLHAQTPFRKTVRFIAFTLEGAPYFRTRHMGSRVYVRSLKVHGEQVEAMISLEMLGYYSQEEGSQSYPFFWLRWWHPSEGNFITVVSNFSSTDLRDHVHDALKASMNLPVETFTGPWWIPGADLSDHGSFWNEDYPAVMLTDTAFYRNPHYHERTDRPETLDYEAMGELVQGISGVLKKLDLSLLLIHPH